MRTYNISAGDFPDVAKVRQVLSTHEACRDFTKFKKLDEKLLKVIAKKMTLTLTPNP